MAGLLDPYEQAYETGGRRGLLEVLPPVREARRAEQFAALLPQEYGGNAESPRDVARHMHWMANTTRSIGPAWAAAAGAAQELRGLARWVRDDRGARDSLAQVLQSSARDMHSNFRGIGLGMSWRSKEEVEAAIKAMLDAEIAASSTEREQR